MNASQWQAECRYIQQATDQGGDVPEMLGDKAIFTRYCEMQRDAAERDGQHDAAQYIQHCIDDLTPEGAAA